MACDSIAPSFRPTVPRTLSARAAALKPAIWISTLAPTLFRHCRLPAHRGAMLPVFLEMERSRRMLLFRPTPRFYVTEMVGVRASGWRTGWVLTRPSGRDLEYSTITGPQL